jgi:1,4-alpha-glucan branching enzyme
MAKKTKPEQKVKRRKVTFSFESENANEVILMGDFNGWNSKRHPMKSDGDGMWKKTVMIPPGTYEYKFLADGQWMEDPQNDRSCTNCFGTSNSVLNVTQK